MLSVAAIVTSLFALENAKLAAPRLDDALIAQSRYVAGIARLLCAAGDCSKAISLTLDVLPAQYSLPDRPWEHLAESALQEAMWYLRERKPLRGHDRGVSSAYFSPDGTLVLTASEDGTARIWEPQTGREQAILSGHLGIVSTAVFSPDTSQVLTASFDKTARIWDTRTRRELFVLKGHETIVGRAAFSPDGSKLLTAAGRTVRRADGPEAGGAAWPRGPGYLRGVFAGRVDGAHNVGLYRQ